MKSNWTLLPAALLVAVLALAGCGGGSDSAPTTPVDPDPPAPTVPKADLDAAQAKNTAYAEAGKAAVALEMANAVLMDAADKHTKFGTKVANGDSISAYDNANAVLMAQGKIEAELGKAKAAIAAINAVSTDGLSDEDKGLIAAQLKAAEDDRDAIQDILDDEKGAPAGLADYVAAVAGPNLSKPKSAADRGQAVAMAIASIFPAANQANQLPDPVTTAPTAGTPKGWMAMVTPTDAMTFEEITGAKFKSVGGMTRADLGLTSAPAVVIGTTVDTASYMGIGGTVVCVSGCALEGDDGDDQKLTGEWTFTPTNADARWVMNETGTYVSNTDFGTYGYWLDQTAPDAAPILGRFAASATPSTITLDLGQADGEDVTAEYTGSASGFSMSKQVGADGEVVKGSLKSGEFTATVELEATFATAPMLGGSVSDFKGAATNPSWTVILNNTALTNGAHTDGTTKGVTNLSQVSTAANDGGWTAAAYGPPAVDGDNQRPTGFVGGFDAHFSDGHAGGVYYADK